MEAMSREKKTVKVVDWRVEGDWVEVDPEWLPVLSDFLYLLIKIRQVTSCSDDNDGAERAVYDWTSQQCFSMSARLLRGEDEGEGDEEEAEQALSSMLSEMELTPQRHQTAHYRIIRRIISSCRSSDSVSVAGAVQLITVHILVCTILGSEIMEWVILEGCEGEDEDEEDRCCSICLEKLPIGQGLMRMACGHVYHTQCILRWLQTSDFCPFCRFRCPILGR